LGQKDAREVRATFVRRVVAVVILFLLVALWVGMVEVAGAMQQGCDDVYHKPFAICFVIHACYVLFLFVYIIVEIVERCCYTPIDGINDDETLPYRITFSFSNARHRWVMFHATWLGLFTFAVGYTFYLSLPLISAAANVAIYNSAGAFVYIFCLIFRMERFNWIKILALIFSIGGVCLVQFLSVPRDATPCDQTTTTTMVAGSTSMVTATTMSSTAIIAEAPAVAPPGLPPATWGYIFVTVSTILYALYEVLYKRLLSPDKIAATLSKTPEHTGIPTKVRTQSAWIQVKLAMLAIGWFGLVQLLLLWPGFFIVNALDIETFELPRGRALASLLVTAVMDTFFNVLLLSGIALTSPLFITVGCLLTIPVSIFTDYMLHKALLSGGALGGVACIAVGFLVLSYAEYREHKAMQLSKAV